jgi:VWFA-related protein
MNSSRRIATIILGLALTLLPIDPQQAATTFKTDVTEVEAPFKTGVTVVNVPVTVRGSGLLVTDLNKNDFEILDNGKRQEISYFAHQADVPLNVALLVDVSGSVLQIIEVEKVTAGQFLEQVLRPHDRGTIVSFADSVVLWQDFTSSMDLLRAGLTKLKDVGAPTPFLRRNPKEGGTALYDAITTTVTQKFPLQTGTKVMIVLSDGLDTISQGTLESAVGAAQAMEVVVYSICREDPSNSEMARYRSIHASDFIHYASGCAALKALSEPTGGRMFSISKTMSMQMIFEVIGEEIRSQYLLGFSPSNPGRPGTRRKLQVRTTRSDLIVQARKGLVDRSGAASYYVPKDNKR